jgi:methyl-accepting chemotaxis protein
MTKSSEMIERTVALAVEAGGALGQIVEAADASTSQIAAISQISEKQILTSGRLEENADNVARVSGEMARQMEAAESVVEEFRGIIHNLTDVVKELEDVA